jgi:hypothetical protein
MYIGKEPYEEDFTQLKKKITSPPLRGMLGVNDVLVVP